MGQNNGRLKLSIADDGIGFDSTASYPGHVGLLSMPERAAKLGGAVSIDSTPGAGTTVVALLDV
jgi:signal transduction histidine kinase